jgi:hypothetical protein
LPALLLIINAFAQTATAAEKPAVYFVLFTHIEDNLPNGNIGTPEAKTQYLQIRTRLIEVAKLAKSKGIVWSYQPDWKILLAGLAYEDSLAKSTTNKKNALRYMKEDLGVIIDPHSHEGMGYNYTDVAHLLDSLGVGGSTVIGGHVWDPALPQFAHWDRFRTPQKGKKYPWAEWRGDILMGSGTPNHVNDPIISGVWRPKDTNNYFVHDPDANIACVGAYKGTIECIDELVKMRESGYAGDDCMMTVSYHLKPGDINAPGGMKWILDSVITPLSKLQSDNIIKTTDFTTLVNEWKSEFAEKACLIDSSNLTGVSDENFSIPDYRIFPNPTSGSTSIEYTLAEGCEVSVYIYDNLGREIIKLNNGIQEAGLHRIPLEINASNGVYFYKLKYWNKIQTGKFVIVK